mmetsp:Transcript_11110/g.35405  ORF Transcript_11110/g.35405 Transcript_11110/m.35405 type:complete len:300 (-) Transcript_11110:121-1020(-)
MLQRQVELLRKARKLRHCFCQVGLGWLVADQGEQKLQGGRPEHLSHRAASTGHVRKDCLSERFRGLREKGTKAAQKDAARWRHQRSDSTRVRAHNIHTALKLLRHRAEEGAHERFGGTCHRQAGRPAVERLRAYNSDDRRAAAARREPRHESLGQAEGSERVEEKEPSVLLEAEVRGVAGELNLVRGAHKYTNVAALSGFVDVSEQNTRALVLEESRAQVAVHCYRSCPLELFRDARAGKLCSGAVAAEEHEVKAAARKAASEGETHAISAPGDHGPAFACSSIALGKRSERATPRKNS